MDLWIGKESDEMCSDINMNVLSCKDKKHVLCGFSGRVFSWNGHSLCILFIECIIVCSRRDILSSIVNTVCSEHEQLVGDQCVSVSKEESEDSCLKMTSHKYPQGMGVGLSYDTAQTAVQYVGFSFQLNGSSSKLCFRQGELRVIFQNILSFTRIYISCKYHIHWLLSSSDVPSR